MHFTPDSIRTKLKTNIGADFSHNGGTQAISSNTWTKLLNDAVSSSTNESNSPLGSPTLYDKTNHRYQLDPFPEGSLIGIRIDAVITPVAAAQMDIRLHWQAKDGDGEDTFSFDLTKTLGHGQAGTAFNILEPFEFTIDGEQQRQGYIEIHIHVAGTTATFQMNGVKIHKKS